MGRFTTAWRAFWRILRDPDTAERWHLLGAALPGAERTPDDEGPDPAPGTDADAFPRDAVYTLVLLQREGRLIDFLMEDVDQYGDAQIGAAVRQIHAKCREVLSDTFGVEAVRAEQEGEPATVTTSFDPRQTRLIGDPAGDPPFNGTLRHCGWRVTKVEFPERHAKLDPTIICPAEVEV